MDRKLQQTTLEQWQVLRALAENGGLARAADALGKSPSTLSYLLRRLQQTLGVELTVKEGRKAVLSSEGALLLDRASLFLDTVRDVEALAGQLANGREAVVRLTVDTSFPAELLTAALRRFDEICQGTRLELHEAVMSGVNGFLLAGDTDIAVGLSPPPTYLSDPLLSVEFVLVSTPDHPLQQIDHPLSVADLERETQVVVRDSGPQKFDRGWISPTNRWSVSNVHAAYTLIASGLCFGRLPVHWIEQDVIDGRLAVLKAEAGHMYSDWLYLTQARREGLGPAATEMVKILKHVADSYVKDTPPQLPDDQ